MTPPKRYKSADQMSVQDFMNQKQTGEVPETNEYRQARRDALEDAGLLDEEQEDELLIDQWDVARHMRRMQS